jgi:hypothetical protein
MKIQLGAEGRFKIQVVRADGTLRVDRPWQDNLITTYGMEYMSGKYRDSVGLANLMSYCRVGTGTSPPAFGDVALGAQVGVRDSTAQSSTAPVSNSATPFAGHSRVYTFVRGAVVGNLTELGLSYSETGSNLCTRALFLDTNGQPVTIVVAADEQLIVTYEVRMYIPTEPTSSSVTDPTTGIAYTIRALPVNAVAWAWVEYLLGGQIGASPTRVDNISLIAYSGSNAAIREWHNTPLGTETYGRGDYQSFPVSDGSYARDSVITIRLEGLNGIDVKVLRLSEESPAYFAPINWQFEFTPTFRKTADQTISITVRVEIARR